MQVEYLRAVLSEHGPGYYKVEVNGETRCWNILSPSQGKKFARTQYQKEQLHLPYLVLPQDFMSGTNNLVYSLEDACRLDLLTIAPFDDLFRHFHVCDVRRVDVGCCMEIVGSRPASLTLGPEGVLSLDCPELLVMAEARRLEWFPGRVVGAHPAGQTPPAAYMPRGDHSCKHYLQALMRLLSTRLN
eukprot:7133879-Pyramimonas_sp.AAC.1